MLEGDHRGGMGEYVTLDGAYLRLQCGVHMAQAVDNMVSAVAVLVADVKTHWAVLCIQGHEIESDYVHLLPLTE